MHTYYILCYDGIIIGKHKTTINTIHILLYTNETSYKSYNVNKFAKKIDITTIMNVLRRMPNEVLRFQWSSYY